MKSKSPSETTEYTKYAGELTVADLGPGVIISWFDGKTVGGKLRVKRLTDVSYVQHAVAISTGKVNKTQIQGKTANQTWSSMHTVDANTEVVVQIVSK